MAKTVGPRERWDAIAKEFFSESLLEEYDWTGVRGFIGGVSKY